MNNVLFDRSVLCWKKNSTLLPLIVIGTVFACLFCCDSARGQNTTKKRTKPPSLVQLIAGSESLEVEERAYWFQNLPIITAEKRNSLRMILETERSNLADIDRKYGGKPAPVPKLHGVKIDNKTASSIVIEVPGYWFDENGEKHREEASWSISPKTSSYLVSEKQRIHASKFLYQIKQAGQVYPSKDRYWLAYYDPDYGTIVTITDENLADRRVVAKPVIDNDQTDWGQVFDDLNEIVEGINDISDAYDDNIKPIVSGIKKARTINSYRVFLDNIEVAGGKSNGKYWDAGEGAPDLVVRLNVKTFLGDDSRTGIINDSYYGTYEDISVRAKLGQIIEITVHDEDAFANDLIGSCEFELTEERLERGQISIGFDQVDYLLLRFER